MMTHQDLWERDNEDRRSMVRHEDPETSHEAADTVELSRDRQLCLDVFKSLADEYPHGLSRAMVGEVIVLGSLDREGREQRARIESLRKRVTDLVEAGYIRATGKKMGREQLLVLTEKGEA